MLVDFLPMEKETVNGYCSVMMFYSKAQFLLFGLTAAYPPIPAGWAGLANAGNSVRAESITRPL